MARRPTLPPTESPRLTPDQIRNRVGRIERCIADLTAFDPQAIQKRFAIPEVQSLEANIEAALSAAFGHGTPAYNNFRQATTLDHGPVTMRVDPMWGGGDHYTNYDAQDAAEARVFLAEGKDQALALLASAVRLLKDELEEHDNLSTAVTPQPRAARRKIFVVHGHDEAALQSMARFLEHLDLEPIVLKEQPDKGLTVIEKFVEYAGQARFAVVLLTPDDLGGAAAAVMQQDRARQNVIFELGFFVGQLGRGQVCLMRKGQVEMPSDLLGVIYKDMDPSEGWKLKLGQELKVAGLDFDANKLWT